MDKNGEGGAKWFIDTERERERCGVVYKDRVGSAGWWSRVRGEQR